MATLDLKSFKVLVVDPDRFHCAILREMLRSLRCWNIQEAADLEAIQPALDPEVDLLIAGLFGADGAGPEAIKQIRAGETAADRMLPIITLMADTSKRNVMLARDAGTSELLAKPVTMKRLFERLAHAILAPRPFVEAATYVGPDRRRFVCADYHGPNRRAERRGETDESDDAAIAKARGDGWPNVAPFIPPTPKLADIRTRAERNGIGVAEAVGNVHRSLKDLEDHHSARLAQAIGRAKAGVIDPETINDPHKLAQTLGPPALEIASTAPVFGFTLAGDIAWMLRVLVTHLPLQEAPVLAMCRRLVETLRVTRDACVYSSTSPEGERVLEELQRTYRRLMKRYGT